MRVVHRVLPNLALACGSLLVLALLLELLLTMLVPIVYRPRFTKLDETVGWYHTPGASGQDDTEGHRYKISYNSHGYRGQDRPFEKPIGVRRIVVLGDSFTDGSEVGDDELFTFKLEQLLSDVEVINLGVYGYQTAQELLTLEHRGMRYSPDAVLLMVVPNDLPGNVVALESFGPAPRFVLVEDSIELEGLDHPNARKAFRVANIPVPGWIHRNSTLYYLINTYIYQPLVANRIRRFATDRLAEVSDDQQRELFRRIVRRMRDLCAERGIPLLVVFTHQRNDVRSADSSQFSDLAESLQTDGIGVLDLFEQIRSEELSGRTIFYRHDPHWNAVGHELVAHWLKAPVRELLSAKEKTAATPNAAVPQQSFSPNAQ